MLHQFGATTQRSKPKFKTDIEADILIAKSKLLDTLIMSMFYALMALCLTGNTLAQVVTTGDCPDAQVQENVDISKVMRYNQKFDVFQTKIGLHAVLRLQYAEEKENCLSVRQPILQGKIEKKTKTFSSADYSLKTACSTVFVTDGVISHHLKCRNRNGNFPSSIEKEIASIDISAKRKVITSFAGKWYQQERFYASFESDTECSIFEYTPGPNNTLLGRSNEISAITGNKESYQRDILTPDLKEPAKLLINIPMSPVEGYDNLWILGTDYDNWGVLFCCTVVRGMNAQYAWILTRERIPDDSVLATAKAVLLKNKVNTSLLVKIEQEGCRN